MPLDYYHELALAISEVIKDVRKNDSHVNVVEIHGAQSGYRISFIDSPPLPPNHWKVTRIETDQ